jgi:hypothetical protein
VRRAQPGEPRPDHDYGHGVVRPPCT